MEAADASLPADHFSRLKIVLAVSGGADSVAMLHLVHALWSSRSHCSPSHLAIAHYNHLLRGDASNDDQATVAQLAQELKLSFFTETAPRERVGANEADLRKVRYDFLRRTAESIGARYVFAAHTSDDNIETFLHHLLRGSGALGLAGIAKHRSLGEQVVLYRPLLEVSREQLRSALRERELSWREDASNADNQYQRNWIRNKLLPTIRERYPQVDKSLGRTIQSQRHIHEQLSEEASQWFRSSIEYRTEEVQVRRGPIKMATLAVIVQMVWDQMGWPRKSISNQHLHRLHDAITKHTSQSFTLPGDIQCRLGTELLWLRQGKGDVAPSM